MLGNSRRQVCGPKNTWYGVDHSR